MLSEHAFPVVTLPRRVSRDAVHVDPGARVLLLVRPLEAAVLVQGRNGTRARVRERKKDTAI